MSSDKDGAGKMRADPWLLIAAYDVSTGASSEGYVALSLLRQLKDFRVVLVTRRNNKARLALDPHFASDCPNVRLVGFDLPRWASWWKRGARFYQLYTYLWQLFWPLALRRRIRLRDHLSVVHVFNFHNDSIPSLAWLLRRPVVWGPINHNELPPPCRREFWPHKKRILNIGAFALRAAMWRFDPLLRLTASNAAVILAAGEWVDQRLNLSKSKPVIRRSQLGVDENTFSLRIDAAAGPAGRTNLVYVGRLDWIKCVDLAIEAVAALPLSFHLLVIGEGPAESQLHALTHRLGLSDRVTFQRPVPRELLSPLYGCADTFIFPSAEAAGLVWVEALAAGLPVVGIQGETELTYAAHRMPGIFLAPAKDLRREQVIALADAVEHATRQPTDRAALRDAALREYSWHSLAAAVRQTYRTATETMR